LDGSSNDLLRDGVIGQSETCGDDDIIFVLRQPIPTQWGRETVSNTDDRRFIVVISPVDVVDGNSSPDDTAAISGRCFSLSVSSEAR